MSYELPGTVCWVLVHVKDAAAEVMHTLDTDAVTVQFSFADEPGDPLRLAGVTADGRIDLTWTRQLPEMEISAPGWMQRRLGELVCEGLHRLAAGSARPRGCGPARRSMELCPAGVRADPRVGSATRPASAQATGDTRVGPVPRTRGCWPSTYERQVRLPASSGALRR